MRFELRDPSLLASYFSPAAHVSLWRRRAARLHRKCISLHSSAAFGKWLSRSQWATLI